MSTAAKSLLKTPIERRQSRVRLFSLLGSFAVYYGAFPDLYATIFLFPLTSAGLPFRVSIFTVLCTFAFCPKKAKSNSEVYLKMEMLVT